MDDPSFIARVWEFLWAVVSNFWLLLTGTILVIEQVFEFLVPGVWRRIEARYPKGKRRSFLLWCALGAFVVASFQAFDDVNVRLRQAQKQSIVVQSRHLTSEERSRMVKALSIGASVSTGSESSSSISFEVIIDSAANCDECEVYAEEFRDFVNSISHWTAKGGPLLIAHKGRGIQLYTAEGADRPEVAEKFGHALLAAGLPFSWEAQPVNDKQSFTVLIGRPK
jgi:hypothetical protein